MTRVGVAALAVASLAVMGAGLAALVAGHRSVPKASLSAPGRSPASIMGDVIKLIVVADECRLPLTDHERARLGAAGQRLRVRLGLSDQAIEAIRSEIARDAKDADCAGIAPAFAEVLRSTLAEAEHVP